MSLDVNQQPSSIVFEGFANGLHHLGGVSHVMNAVKSTNEVVTVVICYRLISRVKK